MRPRVAFLLIQLSNYNWSDYKNDASQAEGTWPIDLIKGRSRLLEERCVAEAPRFREITGAGLFAAEHFCHARDQQRAVHASASQRAPAKFDEGLGQVQLIHNRRLVCARGRVHFVEQASEIDANSLCL